MIASTLFRTSIGNYIVSALFGMAIVTLVRPVKQKKFVLKN
jgi:hypothetical protein